MEQLSSSPPPSTLIEYNTITIYRTFLPSSAQKVVSYPRKIVGLKILGSLKRLKVADIGHFKDMPETEEFEQGWRYADGDS